MGNTPPRFLKRIQAAKAQQLKELDLSCHHYTDEDQKLTEIPDAVFELEGLEVLKLQYNRLTTIPESITRLTNLTQLYLGGNQLFELPESIKKLSKLVHLSLNENKLTEISESLTDFPNLVHLNLSGNKLNEFPESIKDLSKLTHLSLNKNQFTELPKSITYLLNLVQLSLSNNQLTELPESIKSLSNLVQLFLNVNQLTELPESITHLPNLAQLSLSENQLTELPESIKSLSNLTRLNLSGNQFNKLPESLTHLYNLAQLSLSKNQLTELPESIDSLSKLTYLFLNENQLMELPESLTRLSNLTRLFLSKNRLRKLPESIDNLSNIEQLYLGENQLTELPESLTYLPNLTKLYVNGNPLKSPPIEVVMKGQKAIKSYFRQRRKEGRNYLYEAKLLIIGEGGAGKTTLTNKLRNSKYRLRKNEDYTQGIDIVPWHFKSENNQDFRVNIWDFGGQAIYHNTHQFFLTKRSLYVLVADSRKEDTDFYYWLNVVDILSDNSPLIIIQNEKQDRQQDIEERQLRGEFTNLKKILATNLNTNRNLEDIEREIKHYISSLPHVGDALPKSWVRVREALEKDRRNYINLDEYLKICQKNGCTRLQDKFRLSSYLHDLGIILHFQNDAVLKHTVILKPEWGTDAVYRVLDNAQVKDDFGKFTQIDLSKIWYEDEYNLKQDELLQLMCKFKLCYEYEIPCQHGHYIAPQLLSENKPEYDWNNTDNLILRYTYEKFMPKGILTQFIVEMHEYIDQQQDVWKTGVILNKDETKAEVIEYYRKREITVRVVGRYKKEFLTILTHELDKIHASYKRLKYSKLIPCNCSVCKSSQTPHFYSYNKLRERIAHQKYDIECGNPPYNKVSVLSLIDDVTDRRQFQEEDKIDKERGLGFDQLPINVNVNVSQENHQNQEENSSMSTMNNNNNHFGEGNNLGGDYVNRDKIGTQINNSQNLTQAAKDIKELLYQLSQQYDITAIVGAKAIEEIERNPTLKARVINALKEAGTTAFEELVDHPAVNIVVAGAKGFIES